MECLISHGADVNAVAEGDIMPLQVAEKAPEESENKERIIDILLRQ